MSTVKLPRQVQKQVDAAAAIEQSLQSAAANPAPVVNDVTTLVAPVPAPANPPPVETPPQPPAAVEPKAPKSDDFEHKYRVLQGMHRKTTDELGATQVKLRELEERLSKLTETPPAPPPKPAADPKDIETFGADMIAMVTRHAEATFEQLSQQFATRFTALEGRLVKLEQGLTGVSKQTTQSLEQAFWAELERLVPDFAVINESQDFLDWLVQVDPVYGVPRQAALATGEQALDAKRVAAVFNAFKATKTPPSSPAPNPLASQVAPSTAATAAPVPPTQDRTPVSAAAVRQFYDDVRRGVYAGREAEMQRIEAAINQAAAEGRIM